MPADVPTPARDAAALLAAARAGDRRATGRLLSMVERGGDAARRVAATTFAPAAAVEHVVGLTGAPGAGKSTLTDRLVAHVRAGGRRVGVLAIDPSSPFTGGAILGDRVRMQGHALDDGVFIRSMATRGHLGGLALAAPEAVRVLAAAGLPVVLVETVGVGQVEVEVARRTDTTVVVVTPGWGDSIQATKAGLLEVADVFVVNKADRPGAAAARRDLEAMLDLGGADGGWRPPVLEAVASAGTGVEEVWAAVTAHGEHLRRTGRWEARRAARLEEELAEVLLRLLERDVRDLAGGARWAEAVAEVTGRRQDPHAAAVALLAAAGLP